MNHRISFHLIALALPVLLLSYLFIDQSAALWCHDFFTPDLQEFLKIISKFGESQYYLISALLLFLTAHYYWKNPALANLALLIIAVIVVSGLSADIIKFFAGRYRPSELFEHGFYGFVFFQTERAMTSFPSGHTATVFSLATLFITLWPKSSKLLWSMALLVGGSRIGLNAHYPSDVIAGALVGILSTQMVLAYWNPSKIFKRSRFSYRSNRYYYLFISITPWKKGVFPKAI